MITKNRVIAERLLREFIRGSFGIISEASPKEEYDPSADEDAADAAMIVDNQKKAHLEAAQEFVNSRAELLEQILDGIEGPLAVTGLEQLQRVLNDAMRFDDTYKKEDQINRNLATTFTCLSLAEGDVHNIPYLMAAFGKAFAVKAISKSRSGKYTVSGQIKDVINESGGPAGSRPVAEIIDKEIEKIIPLLFGDRTKLAQDVLKKSERFDFDAPGYAKVEVINSVLSPGKGKKPLSFRDALKSSALETIKIQNVALGKSKSHIAAEEEAIEKLNQEIYELDNTLINLRNKGTSSGNVYDALVKSLDTTVAQKETKEIETLPDFIRESDAMLRVLERRLDDDAFLLSKIREFANSTLEGWERTAANYPKMSGAIKTAGSYVGKKTIGATLSALVYGVYEITPANIIKIDFEYELAQEEAIEYIAQMFEDNDMGNFAKTLRSYKS